MEVEKDKKIHSVLSNVFYYTFVLIILTVFVLSLVVEEITLLNNILFISLIVSSIVIVFYLTVQMLRYNLTVNKKIQVGIFFVVIGFLLILLSTSKKLSFIESLDLDFLGYNFFVYWGIGSVVLGIFVELTFLDQVIWKLLLQPFKQLWKITVKFAKWVRKHWLNIILYTLDLASTAGIIYVAIFWGTDWWKIIVLSVSCIYPVIHHHKRIWNAIKFIAVDMIYEFLTKVGEIIKSIFTSIWMTLVSFAKFLVEHRWSILKEILRWIGAAGGGVMIYFGATITEYWFLIVIGIVTIVVSLLFTRKVILTFLWDVTTSVATFFWDRLVAFVNIFIKNWWPILKEILRLAGAAGGAYLIYHGYVFNQFAYLIAIGIVLIVISLILSRKAVLIGLWSMMSSLFNFIWENIIKPHYKRLINETVRLILVGGGIFLIYYGIVNDVFSYFVYIGITVIILAEVIIRKRVLRAFYQVIKNIASAFWDFLVWLGRPLSYLWRVTVNLVKLLIENWFKVILYILDLVALAAIICLSITWIFEWWYIVLISISCLYIPVHHYKLVWRFIKFIGTKIFYNPFLRFVNIILDFFKALWNYLVDSAKFIKKHLWSFTKEVLRLAGVAGGITLIVYSFILEDLHLAWIGIAVILISEIFSRKIMLTKIYEFFKAIFSFIYGHRTIISRILGFFAVIAGVIIYFVLDNFIAFILLESIGGTFVLFAHFIFHPKKLWEFLVSIPKTLHKILATIWLTIKSGSIYIYQNGIRLILLVAMIFTFVYGLFVIFNFDFIGIFETITSVAIRISLGALFDVVAVVAFILLRRELKKLRSGSSKGTCSADSREVAKMSGEKSLIPNSEDKQSESLERNPVITTLWIGFTISVLSIIGIIIVAVLGRGYDDVIFRIVLGVFVIGVLILFFALILRRLRNKGIDYFVTGAITAYIGFILVAFPAILVAVGVTAVTDYVFYILMGAGAILIVFGFFFEAYDLNLKILALMKKLREALKRIWKKINWKLILSPLNLLSVAGITVIILAAVKVLEFINPLYWYLIGGGLILINIIWHFRKEIAEILVNIGKVISTLFQAWWRAIKQIPQIIKKLGIWIYTKTVEVLKIIGKSFKFVIIRNYLILFVFGIAMFLVLHFLGIFELEVRIALSSLVCGIAIVKPILDWREHFGEGISTARMYLYKTAQKTKRVFQYRKLTRCPNCNRPNEISKEFCWNCETLLPKCMICNSKVEKGTIITKCQLCDNVFHTDHLETWLRFSPKCPVCKDPIDKKEEEFQPESTYEEEVSLLSDD